MKGYLALTSTWKRPVMPAPQEVFAVDPVKPKKPKLTREQRKRIYEMDLLIRETAEEMEAVFKRAGLSQGQRLYQLKLIRRNRG